MPPFLISVLTNKFTYLALAIIAIVGYYNIKIIDMQVTYNLQVAKYNTLYTDHMTLDNQYKKVKNNLRSMTKTNDDNIIVIERYKADLEKAKEISNIQNDAKDKEILSLLETVRNLRELPSPDYNQSIMVKDCAVQISEGGTEYEKQKLNNISNIGK